MKNLLYILLFVPIAMFGQENYSLDFTNNTVDYVAIDSGLEFQSLESVSFVVKTKKQAEISFWDGAIFDISDGECDNCWSNRYSLGIENNEVNFGLEGTSSPGGSVSSGIHQIEGEWVYIVIIGDVILNEVRMYLNGNLVGSEQLSNSENLFSLGTGNDNSKILGKRSSLTPFSREFHGFIDEFHIWDKPLSNNEIQEYMMCNPSGNEEGLIAYWSFNEGSGDTAYDLSVNGNHGVIYDVAYSEDVPEETCSSIIDQLNQSFDAWNISIDLSSGWNMIGYGCPSPLDVIDALSSYTEQVIIIKDNLGSIYMPEFGFNGIGDFTPGFGYQIKVTEAIEGFSLCDWYVNDIPEDNIISLQEENTSLHAELDSLYGCIDESACNFDSTAFVDDGSCYNNDLGCGCDTPGPIEGFDCDGNELPEYQVGDFAEGGIVFYVDETGQHGLVAALEDLGQFEWGCYGMSISGADGQAIGTGYQNTIDIVNQGCSTENGGITAAQASLDAEINGYSEWYLPSKDELNLMYYSIGQGSEIGNIGDFMNSSYWSSSEYENGIYPEGDAWYVNFDTNFTNSNPIYSNFSTQVRPIRSF